MAPNMRTEVWLQVGKTYIALAQLCLTHVKPGIVLATSKGGREGGREGGICSLTILITKHTSHSGYVGTSRTGAWPPTRHVTPPGL